MVKNNITAIFCSIFFLLSAVAARSQSTYNNDIKQVAVTLYKSFSTTQKMAGGLHFSDTARMQWNNLPVGLRPRVGVSIGNMTEDQRKLLHRVLSVSLSSQGYLKATSILHLDDLLNRFFDSLYYKKEIDEKMHTMMRGLLWSHKNFYFAFFGAPTDSIWGYKLEGHHLSINFTFVKDQLSVTPFFIGTDPAEYPNSEYAGWRVLGQEEDLGIKLITMLPAAQQKKATMSSAVPQDIITAAESGKRLVDNWGLLGSEMTKDQQTVLLYIIREFVLTWSMTKQ